MGKTKQSKRKADASSMQSSKKLKLENENHIEVNEDVSEYGILRQKNIEHRERLFRELKLGEAANELKSVALATPSKPSKRGLAAIKKPKLETQAEPERKSLRLRRIDPDTGLTLPEKEPKLHTVSSVEDRERHPLTDLYLSDVAEWRTSVGVEAMQSLAEEKKIYLQTLSSCREPKLSDRRCFEGNLRKSLGRLKISAEDVCKVTPSRIFSMSIHPSESTLLLAAGDKWGSVGLWKVDDVTSETHGVQVFYPHVRPINCLTFSSFDSNKLISTSYDGTVRALDLENQVFNLVYGTSDDESSFYTGYHCQLTDSTFLISLGRTGIVGLVDTRVSNLKRVRDYQAFDGVSARNATVHPVKRDYFMASNTRAECCIFDMRGKSKNLKAVSSLTGHTKALSSSTFSPVTGNTVVTVSYDNKLRIYDVTNFEQKLVPKIQISHNNQTGQWLTTFKAEWQPRRDDLFFVGSMSSPRQLDAYTSTGDHYTLQGEHLTTICSIVKSHPSLEIVAGGNSSGRAYIFR